MNHHNNLDCCKSELARVNRLMAEMITMVRKFAPIIPPEVAELQAQLERYKAVMDELLDAVNEAMYSNTTDNAKAKAFKSTAHYNALFYAEQAIFSLEQKLLLSEPKKPECTWEPDEDAFQTTCGNAFVLNDGDPRENGILFCPYCGGKLKQAVPNVELSGSPNDELETER